MPRALMNLRALRTLVVLLGLLAHVACANPAHAQPAIRELRSPKGLLQLDSRLFLFADDGTAGTLAWIDDACDMLPLEDGVLVAGTNLALYGYTLLTDEAQPDGGSTPPLWKADIRNAALATDGTSPLALGVPPESALDGAKPSTLLVMRRAADGSWITAATNIPVSALANAQPDVSVARVVWAGDRWLAAISREAPADVVEQIRTSMQSSISRTDGVDAQDLERVPMRFFRAEIWQSPDGRNWTRTELPTRAQHCRNESFARDLEVIGANQTFLASVYGRLYRAGASLEWVEIATPLGEGMPVDDLSYADGRFLAHGRGWIATSADAISWSTWARSWDFPVSENGPHVANGSFRWFSNEDPPRNLTLDETVANKTPLQQAPPAAQEVRDLSAARLIAPDPSGTVAVIGEHLRRRNPDGTMQSGMFVGMATSLTAGVDGIAIASDMLRFVTYDKLDAATASLPLNHARTASDASGVAAIGDDPSAKDNLLRFARIVDGTRWEKATTQLARDITPLALTHDGTRWCLLARKDSMVFGKASDTDAWYWPELVVFTSSNGIAWDTEGLPLPYPIQFEESTGAVVSGPDADALRAMSAGTAARRGSAAAPSKRIVVAYGNRIYTRVADAPWSASKVELTRMLQPWSQVSLAMDALGTICWAGSGNALQYSYDGARWRPFVPRELPPNQDFVWTRNGTFEGFDGRMGKFGAIDELYWPYPKRRLAAPEKPTPAELSFPVANFSGLLWDGERLVAATDRGIMASEDGVRFTPWSEATVAPLSETDPSIRGIAATSKAYWLFMRARGMQGDTAAKVLRVDRATKPTVTEAKVPIRVHDALAVGDTIAFLGTKSQWPMADTFVAWSDDDGATWSETKLPLKKRTDKATLVHGAFGWATVGVDGADVWSVATSPDLRTWTTLALPDPGSIRELSIGAVGDKIVLHASTVAAKWAPAADRLLWSRDGESWTSAAIPESWLAPTLSKAGWSRLRCSNGYGFLQLEKGWIYSRDLERWHPLPGFGEARSDLNEVVTRDGVALLSIHPLKSENRLTPTILRSAIATDAELPWMAGLMLPPCTLQPLGEDAVWIDALVRWDAELNDMPERRTNPFPSTRILLERLRAKRPGRPNDDDIRLAAFAVLRCLGHGADEAKLGSALDLMSVMNDATGQPADEGTQRMIAALRTKDLGQLADLLLDLHRARSGQPRQFRFNPLPDATKPPASPAIMDIDLLRARAAAGDAGAAYDLSQIYDRGEGAMMNFFAFSFWKQEAIRLGFADPSTNERNPFKGFLDQESNKTSAYWMLQKHGEFLRGGDVKLSGPHPDPSRATWALGEAAKLGCWEAMEQLANDLHMGSGDPDELAEALRLAEIAASRGNRAAIMRLGLLHLTGAGVARNRRLGADYLRLAAEQGNLVGTAFHAKLLALGFYGADRVAEAEEWIKRVEARNPKDAEFIRTRLASLGSSLLSERYAPQPTSDPWMDNAARLRQAQVGDPAACEDVSYAYTGGSGFLIDPEIGNWWLARAQHLGWDPNADSMTMAKKGAIGAYGDPEVINGLGDGYLDAAIAAGFIPAMTNRAETLLGTGNAADRASAMELYRKAAAMGSAFAAIELGKMLSGTDNLAERLKYFEQASLAGDPVGHALCAMAFRQGSSWSEADRVRVLRALLRMAGVSTVGMPDATTDAFRFRLAAARAIEARAETGAPRAMTARGFLIGMDRPQRDTDEIDAYAWARAALLFGVSPVNAEAAIVGLPPVANDVVPRVAEIAWSCTLASEADLPDPFAPHRAWATSAAPGTSQTERALRTLLGVQDGGKNAVDALQNTLPRLRSSAKQLSQANEPIRVGIWRELALAAGIAAEDPALGAKRGRDLFTTLAGLPDIPYDKDAPWEWANAARKALMSTSGNSIRGIAVGDDVKLRDELLKLLAAMEWYGVDLPPNRARAAMSLLLCEDRRTQAISAGYMLSQLTEDERGSFDTFIDSLENIPDN